MQVFNIDKNLLKAAAYAAATDDPRPINGVYLDKDAGKIKSTDGYMYNDPTHRPDKKKRAKLENVQVFKTEKAARKYMDRLLTGA